MKVKFRFVDYSHRVAGIKAVRLLTGMSLKEAKGLVDAAEFSVQEFDTTHDEAYVRQIMEEGRLQLVDVKLDPLNHTLMLLAYEALKGRQYDLAKDIIDVLQRHS